MTIEEAEAIIFSKGFFPESYSGTIYIDASEGGPNLGYVDVCDNQVSEQSLEYILKEAEFSLLKQKDY